MGHMHPIGLSLYRQIPDLYAASVDYDPHSDESIEFFKIVQNERNRPRPLFDAYVRCSR